LNGTKAVNSLNLDLLRAMATHHPDGRPKDPHAHYRAEVKAQIRQRRRDRWLQRLWRLSPVFRHDGLDRPKPCPDHPA
jgi:muconolactone delta-isomerase